MCMCLLNKLPKDVQTIIYRNIPSLMQKLNDQYRTVISVVNYHPYTETYIYNCIHNKYKTFDNIFNWRIISKNDITCTTEMIYSLTKPGHRVCRLPARHVYSAVKCDFVEK